MLKHWFEFSNGNGSNGMGERRNGNATAVLDRNKPGENERGSGAPREAGEDRKIPPASTDRPDFEQIYRGAALKPPQIPCGILRVVEMMNSAHLAAMPGEARRSALLMALEAVGAEIEDVLQDAVVRQRALRDYEEEEEGKLRRFEAAKTEENRNLQAELDRLTKECMSQMQVNLDEVARAQDEFRDWQKKKQREAQRIAEAAAFCVPENMAGGGNLAGVLERACAARR
jgi:hypothetical protein